MIVAGYFCLCVSNHLFIQQTIHPSLPASLHPSTIPASIPESQATPTHFPALPGVGKLPALWQLQGH